MKPELSDIERSAFFKKAELQRGSEHTILFHHLRVGRELPLVRVKRLEDDKLKVTFNPNGLTQLEIIKAIKKSI